MDGGKMRRLAWSLAFVWALWPLKGEAIGYHAGSLGGVMVQPTSSYYHLVYGGYGEVGRDDGALLVRGGYLERPKFSSAGFEDQEFFGFGLIGSRVFHKKKHGLQIFAGGGQTTAFLRDVAGNLESRRYRVPGLVLLAEYYGRWKAIDVAVQHQAFVGHVSDRQLRAYVAWPYGFFLLRMGIML